MFNDIHLHEDEFHTHFSVLPNQGLN